MDVTFTLHLVPNLLTELLEVSLCMFQQELLEHHNDEYSSSGNWRSMLKPQILMGIHRTVLTCKTQLQTPTG